MYLHFYSIICYVANFVCLFDKQNLASCTETSREQIIIIITIIILIVGAWFDSGTYLFSIEISIEPSILLFALWQKHTCARSQWTLSHLMLEMLQTLPTSYAIYSIAINHIEMNDFLPAIRTLIPLFRVIADDVYAKISNSFAISLRRVRICVGELLFLFIYAVSHQYVFIATTIAATAKMPKVARKFPINSVLMCYSAHLKWEWDFFLAAPFSNFLIWNRKYNIHPRPILIFQVAYFSERRAEKVSFRCGGSAYKVESRSDNIQWIRQGSGGSVICMGGRKIKVVRFG